MGRLQITVAWAAMAAAMLGVAYARAQVGGDPPREKTPSAPTDVHVNDSLEAADAIAKATAMTTRDRWTDAAELLQRTADTEGDKLIRVGPGAYVCVREHIHGLIGRWPEAGIAAYRALYEREARTALSAAIASRRIEAILELFDRYFCTSAAAELADTIGQMAVESGDVSLATHIYRKVIERHPDRAIHAAQYEAMLSVLQAIGPPSDRREPRPPPDIEFRWAGQDRPLREVLAEIEATFETVATHPSPVDWPLFGGGEDRNRRASSGVDELGLLWTFDGFSQPPAGAGIDRPDAADDEAIDEAPSTAIYPIVAAGLVFVQRDREIVALHRTTGATAWHFRGGEPGATETLYPDERPPGWESVTVADGRVYAALPAMKTSSFSADAPRTAQLVCLNASSGRLVWELDPRAIAEPFAEISFDTSPIVHGGKLMVLGRRRRTFGFEDGYVYRFDARNGSFLSRTHIGSASTGTFGSRQPTQGMLALSGDTVFGCPNLGTVAALSAHTGVVRWLRLYERDSSAGTVGGGRLGREPLAWHFNPVIASERRLVVLPTDADRVLVVSASDGELIQSIPIGEFEDVETILGLHGNMLCGVGRSVACYDLEKRALAWSTPLPGKSESCGRGAWVEDRLLVPTRDTLSVVHVADGRRTDLSWSGEEEGGTLVALPDQLIVAGAYRVSGYVRRTEIWKTLRERLAAAPTEPVPALELAEVAQNNGEYAEAIAALDEAARRVSVRWDTIDASAPRRLFDDAIAFAGRMHARGVLTPEVLEKLLGYAGQFAPDPSAHVSFRMQFAEIYAAMKLPEPAIRLYQQILRDRTLREVPLTAGGTQEDAARAAQNQIATLINQNGRTAYAAFEAEARRWLETGRAAGDEAALDRVVATFPNSEAAPEALVHQAELLAQRGNAREAGKRFARAYHRYPKDVDRPRLLRKIADAYESAGMPVHAYRWLTKAAREHPTARIEYQGKSISFLDYRQRLAAVRPRVEPSRPRVSLPLNGPASRDWEAATLLVPRFGDEPASDWSRFFVATAEGIRAFRPTAEGDLWPRPAPVRGAGPSLLIAMADRAVFATNSEVLSLDPRTGERLWTQGELAPARPDDRDDWEDVDAIRSTDLLGDRLVVLRNSGEISCIDTARGKVLWKERHPVGPSGRIGLSDPWVVYPTVKGGAAVVGLIDAATGAWLGDMPMEESQAIEEIAVTLDHQIVVIGSRTIAAYDPETRLRKWRVGTNGQVRRASVAADVDALYFSDDGQRVTKIGLEAGKQIWESESVSPGGDDLTVALEEGAVLAASSAAVLAMDSVTGLTLWRGTAPERAQFVGRRVTQSYVVAVDTAGGATGDGAVAFFYDHRNASGIIPADGGALSLGRLGDVRAVLAVDDGLVVQSGSTIHVWHHPP